MFSIGEFSKITGLSVKTLRFYHERELLVPPHVEAGSGYRFYDEKSIETARVIVALRELEFSLDDIRAILSDCQQDADVLEHLEQRKRDVENLIQSQSQIVTRIDQIIRNEREARASTRSTPESVQEVDLPPMLVGGVRMKGRYADMGKAFGRLGRALGRYICGKAMCLYYDVEFREDDADFEPCFPIRKSVTAPELSIRELPPSHAVCLRHKGSYEQLGRSYARLLKYVKDRGMETTLPSREVFIQGPGIIFKGNPKKYVTEIQLLVSS